MAQPPPRPSAPRPSGAGPSQSATGPRVREADKPIGTFFLGRYRVVDEIGVGGMASVHLARMDGPGGFQKWVAIKRIHPHLVEDDQFVDMFLDEARIAAGINHANVAQVFDLGKDDNTYWIAMEYLHGEPLREVMRRAEERRHKIAPELAARICADAAEGLHAAHELRGKNGQLLGLVHRDVTPHNLFITYEGYTKVVDFGIAKVADRLSSTRAGTLKGKLAYMSPEQVRGAEVDRRTDIFALGVVLWELTTGHRLFRMDTDLDTLEKVQACVVPPPSSLVPDYPMELESVVLRALAKRREERFQTAREFSRAMQSYLMTVGSFVGPEEVAHFVRDVFVDRIQKREAHLAWAAEVTSTINVDQLRSGEVALAGPTDEVSVVSYDSEDDAPPMMPSPSRPPAPGPASGPGLGGPPRAPASQPGSLARGPASPRPLPAPAPPPRASSPGAPPAPMSSPGSRGGPSPSAPTAVEQPRVDARMAASSLMDDDEDVPTTVATRDHLEGSGRSDSIPDRGAPPRPAAGAPAPRPAAGAPPPPTSSPMAAATPSNPGFGGPPRHNDELTAALPQNHPMGLPLGGGPGLGGPGSGLGGPGMGGPGMGGPGLSGWSPSGPPSGGLGSTQAIMPGDAGGGPLSGPSFGAPPPSGLGGVSMGMGMNGPAAPTFGAPPPSGPHAPTAAFPAMGMPPHAQPLTAQAGQPQSQVETALSLPRPDPAALWLAHQEAAAGQSRRNTGVLVAVGLLTALCVVGIGTLLYFKYYAAPASTPTETPSGSLEPSPGDEADGEDAETAPPEREAASTEEPTAQAKDEEGEETKGEAAEKEPDKPGASGDVKPSTDSGSTPPTKAEDDAEPGLLTIVCTPFCDDVLDNGRSLGPSPIVQVPVPPGQHRITLKRAGQPQKVISVIVVSGEVTAQRVAMK